MRERREMPGGEAARRPGRVPAGRGAGNREPGAGLVPMSRERALALQRAMGNAAMSRLLDAGDTPTLAHELPRVIQRFHDPGVTNSNKGAAISYLLGNGKEVTQRFYAANKVKDAASLADAMYRLEEGFPGEIEQVNALAAAHFDGRPAVLNGMDSAELGLLVRAVNAMEEDVRTRAVANVESEDIPLGTEFTFVRDDIIYLDSDQGEWKKAREVAMELIEKWKMRVQASRKGAVHASLVNGKAGRDAAVKFTYPGAAGGAWYWVLDIDVSCLETQTMKTSSRGLEAEGDGLNIQDIIKEDIFAVARGLGLAPSRRLTATRKPERSEDLAGGSGHISVDAAMAFGGSVTILIDLLEKLQTDADKWQKDFETRYDTDDPGKKANDPNSPWMKDLKLNVTGKSALDSYLAELRKIRSDAKGGKLDFAGALARLKAFNRNLTENFPTSPKGLQGEELDEHLMHYQAINIEHLGEPGGTARLELRDIPAQESFDRLIGDVNRITAYIDEVRWEYKDYAS